VEGGGWREEGGGGREEGGGSNVEAALGPYIELINENVKNLETSIMSAPLPDPKVKSKLVRGGRREEGGGRREEGGGRRKEKEGEGRGTNLLLRKPSTKPPTPTARKKKT
jgi:hypothetical protein